MAWGVETAEEWNDQHPPGSPVSYHRAGESVAAQEGYTRGPAYTVGGVVVVPLSTKQHRPIPGPFPLGSVEAR